MTTKNLTKDKIDAYHDLLLDQNILLDHGGRRHFYMSDLASLDFDDCAEITGDIEFELALILRKSYAKKHPELRKLAKDIAIKSKT
ncbi:MAG: hypothetical protein HOD92_22960 [Deltaproteobacteria bacterium]|jgi:hypothetical protein|nr:hypothetical protein [Deltaproteobacteria bacterium]